MNKQTILSLTALGALLAGCTTAVIPYAGQSTALINNQPIPNPFPSLFPSSTPTPDAPFTPLPSIEPGSLGIADVQPRTLRAGDTVTVRGNNFDRIGIGEVSLVWDLPDRMLPVTILNRSNTSLTLSFPNFPATLTQVSLHLREGRNILQGYVLRIQDGGATGTPLPALPPVPSGSPDASASPSSSTSPGVTPSASPSPEASPAPLGSVSPAASTSPGSSSTPAPVVSASVSSSPTPAPVVSASPSL